VSLLPSRPADITGSSSLTARPLTRTATAGVADTTLLLFSIPATRRLSPLTARLRMTTMIAGITADTRKGLPAVRLLMVSLLRSNTAGMAVSRVVTVTVEEMLITAAAKEVTEGMTTTVDLLNNRTMRLPMEVVAMMTVGTPALVVIISLAVTTAETTRTALLLMAEEANREGTGVDLLEDTVAAMTKVLLLLALLIKVDTTLINRAMAVHLNMGVAPRPMEVVMVVDTKSAVARSLRLI
jgi:hypothetical protein